MMPEVETWTERMGRLRLQHRRYLTEWVVGEPESDRLAARHERDITYAARCLDITFAAFVEGLTVAGDAEAL